MTTSMDVSGMGLSNLCEHLSAYLLAPGQIKKSEQHDHESSTSTRQATPNRRHSKLSHITDSRQIVSDNGVRNFQISIRYLPNSQPGVNVQEPAET